LFICKLDVLRARLVTQTHGTLKASCITKFAVSFTQLSWRIDAEKRSRCQSTIQQTALRRNADPSDIVILKKQTCHARDGYPGGNFVYVLFIRMSTAINSFESNRRRAEFIYRYLHHHSVRRRLIPANHRQSG
jgi:hypothetical protein